MLAATICGLLCGARGYTGIVEWLHDLPVDIWHWLGFTRRPPKVDCFRDLLMKIDPDLLEHVLRDWVSAELGCPTDEDLLAPVSIDGKTLCATLRPFSKAVHLLAAVDHRTGCVLSQARVPDATNEHKTSLELLKTLVLTGRVVIGDAAFCQRDVCQQIIDSGGEYIFAVKENQPGLLRDIEQEFAAADAAFSPLRPAGTSC